MNKQLLQQALDALIPLSNAHFHSEREMLTDEDVDAAGLAVVALQAAIAQPEQPATAWRMRAMDGQWMFCSKESHDFFIKDGVEAQQLFVRLPATAQPDLKPLVKKVHKAKGRYHTQLAMCDLYDACGLPNVRPGDA